MSSPSTFQITSHYAPSSVDNGFNIISHITHLVDSYFIWVGGTTEKLNSAPTMSAPTNSVLEDEGMNQVPKRENISVDSLVARAMQGGLVAKDWACAMPSRQSPTQTFGTAIFRSGDSDESLAISQRLARRFKKQMLLSLDVPQAVKSSGQASFFLLQVEKHLLETLKSFDSP